ncbi:vWA domain-containing protein [Micromonospora sp. DT229]|uniref:vWA domain-containing protein n=1 Tax=Micromonospora sp. DT229 TaxID=3393430 RepID=UPI003CF40245
MSDWIRRTYDAIGVTQAPPGRHLAALQEPYVGKVLLCIDVSGSMAEYDGGLVTRLKRVSTGAKQFITEATAANYRVGLVLWNEGVRHHVPLSEDPRAALRALRRARSYGGTSILPTLELGIRELGGLTGDRVMAIFGDGDIGPVQPAVEMARHAASLGIRIIVRGLGDQAAGALGQLATEEDEQVTIRSADQLAAGVASMISKVTRRR